MASIKANMNADGKVISYRFRACVGRDENGRQQWITKTQKVTDEYSELTPKKLEKTMQTLADTWQEQEEIRRKEGIINVNDRRKFRTFVLDTFWNGHVLHHKPAPLSATTKGFYNIIIHQLVDAPQFKNKNLSAITTHDIDSYLQSLQDSGMATATQKHHYDVLKIIFRYAVNKDYLLRDPMRKADRVEIVKRPVTRLNAREIEYFHDTIEEHASTEYQAIMFLMLYMGLRRSEVCGLRWGDLDMDGKKKNINICNCVVWAGDTYIKEPKSVASKRKIPMEMKNVYPALLKWRDETKDHRFNRCIDVKSYVFPPSNLQPFEPKNPQCISHWMSRFRAKYFANLDESEFPNLRGVYAHELRHTFASVRMGKKGANPALVSRYMGHSSLDITMKAYVELDTDSLRSVIDDDDENMMESDVG